MATLVERQSRFALLVKVDGKDATTVAAALTPHIRRLPEALRRSLTSDRGSELAKHRESMLATHMKI